MAVGKFLELAVVLKAIDNMSGTVRNALGGASSGYQQLANSQEKADMAMKKGLALGAGAKVAIDVLASLSKQYGNLQEAQQDLRVSMMQPGAVIDEKMFKRYMELTRHLSGHYGSSQMSYVSMIRAMKENKIDGKDILGGIGDAVAELSELFKTAPVEGALFAARLKNDMKVPAGEMIQMVDLAARLKNVGVGHTGSEAIANMTEFYSKAGLGAVNMGMKGTKDAMELGALGGMFIAKGQDAPSVGTTFRRIFDNISKPDKLKAMNEEAAKFGKHLVFFDSVGKFKGVSNFVAQLGLLHGMSTQAIAQILGPAGSSNGMSGTVLKFIGEHGQEEYQDFLRRVADQGNIHDKVKEDLKGQNKQGRITDAEFENLEAVLGGSYSREVTEAHKLTQGFLKTLSTFSSDHQTTTKVIAGLVGLAGGAMAIGSAFKFAGAAWTYSGMGAMMTALGGAFSWTGLITGAETFGLIMTATVLPAIGSIAALLAEIAIPLALLYAIVKYPDKFAGEGKKIAMGLPNILKEGYEDVKSQYNYMVHGIKTPDVKKPITPKANWDQFVKDAERVKKQSIKPVNPRFTNWKQEDITGKLAADLRHSGKNAPQPVSPVVYSPTVNINGNADEKVLKSMLDTHKDEILHMLHSQKVDQSRTKF
jgi:hypothetical protein